MDQEIEENREPSAVKMNLAPNKAKPKFKNWADKAAFLKSRGMGDVGIQKILDGDIEKLRARGMSQEGIKKVLGLNEPDLGPLVDEIDKEVRSVNPKIGTEAEKSRKHQDTISTYNNHDKANNTESNESIGFWSAVKKGAWDDSTLGHVRQAVTKGNIDESDTSMQDASALARLGHGIGTVAGDYAPMWVGMKAGALVGTAVGGLAGTVVGALVGGGLAFALPAAVRKGMVEWHGTVSANDNDTFFQKLEKTAIEAGKDFAVGTITGGAGSIARFGGAKLIKGVTANSNLMGKTVETTALGLEAGVASASASAIHQGELPEAKDFIDNFILMGTLHHAPAGMKYATRQSVRMVSKVNLKLKDIFVKKGEHPTDVRVASEVDPQLKLDLINESTELPRIFDEPTTREKAKTELTQENKLEAKNEIENTKTKTEENVKKELTPLEEAKNKIDEQIKQANKEPKKESIFEKIENKLDEFQYNYLNEQHYVDKMVEQLTGQPAYKLAEIESPTEGLRNAKRTDSLVEHSLLKGAVGFDGSVQSKGLSEIIAPLKDMGPDAIKDFSRFITSKRALEIESQGKRSGFDKTAAELIVKEGEAVFGTIAKDLVDLQNAHLKRLADAGFIKEADYKRMIETNQSYVPFQRIGEQGQAIKSKGGKAVKELKGSDQAIQDPLLSIIDSIEHTYRITEKNRAAQRLIDIAENRIDTRDPNAIIRRVETPAEKMNEATRRINEKMGGLVDIEIMDLYKSGVSAELKDNQFVLWRNGKMEVYETRKEVAQLFGHQPTAEQASLLFQTAKALTQFKKKMITIMPTFMARNMMKDQVTAWVTKESKSVWAELIFKGSKWDKISNPEFRQKLMENSAGMDVVLAMSDIVSKNENYFNYLRHFGSGQSGIIEQYRSMFRGDPDAANILSRSINIIAAPIKGAYKMLDAYGDLMEKSTRLAQAKKVLDAGSKSSPEAMAKAARVVRESTVDFQQMGAKMNALNGIISFLNPHVQGLRKTAKLVREGRYDALARTGVVATASLALWWLQKDDDRYKELNDSEKDLFWHVITDDWVETESDVEFNALPDSKNYRRVDEDGKMWVNQGKVFRLPKPPDIGLFMASLPVRLAEYISQDNPKAFDEFGASVLAMVTPNAAPDLVLPVIEHMTNKNMFTGRAVVPAYLEKASPEYQYTHQTTESAKALGKLIGYVGLGHARLGGLSFASPLVLENYIQSLTGSAGPSLLRMIDSLGREVGMLPKQKSLDLKDMRLEDFPIIGSFVVRNPSMSSNSIQDATKLIAEFEQIQINATVIKDSGDWRKYGEYTLENREKLAKVGVWKDRLTNAVRAIEKVYRLQINEEEGMSALQKRQLVETIYSRAIDASKLFMRQMESVEKEMEERKKREKQNNN